MSRSRSRGSARESSQGSCSPPPGMRLGRTARTAPHRFTLPVQTFPSPPPTDCQPLELAKEEEEHDADAPTGEPEASHCQGAAVSPLKASGESQPQFFAWGRHQWHIMPKTLRQTLPKGKRLCMHAVAGACNSRTCGRYHPDARGMWAFRAYFSRQPCKYGSWCRRSYCMFNHQPQLGAVMLGLAPGAGGAFPRIEARPSGDAEQPKEDVAQPAVQKEEPCTPRGRSRTSRSAMSVVAPEEVASACTSRSSSIGIASTASLKDGVPCVPGVVTLASGVVEGGIVNTSGHEPEHHVPHRDGHGSCSEGECSACMGGEDSMSSDGEIFPEPATADGYVSAASECMSSSYSYSGSGSSSAASSRSLSPARQPEQAVETWFPRRKLDPAILHRGQDFVIISKPAGWTLKDSFFQYRSWGGTQATVAAALSDSGRVELLHDHPMLGISWPQHKAVMGPAPLASGLTMVARSPEARRKYRDEVQDGFATCVSLALVEGAASLPGDPVAAHPPDGAFDVMALAVYELQGASTRDGEEVGTYYTLVLIRAVGSACGCEINMLPAVWGRPALGPKTTTEKSPVSCWWCDVGCKCHGPEEWFSCRKFFHSYAMALGTPESAEFASTGFLVCCPLPADLRSGLAAMRCVEAVVRLDGPGKVQATAEKALHESLVSAGHLPQEFLAEACGMPVLPVNVVYCYEELPGAAIAACPSRL